MEILGAGAVSRRLAVHHCAEERVKMRTKAEVEELVGYLAQLINLCQGIPVLAGWLLERQIELKREIMERPEYQCR